MKTSAIKVGERVSTLSAAGVQMVDTNAISAGSCGVLRDPSDPTPRVQSVQILLDTAARCVNLYSGRVFAL